MKILLTFKRLIPIIIGVILSSSSLNASDSITVNFFLLDDCKICQYYATTIQDLYNTYNDENTTFVGYFPNRYSSEKDIEMFKDKYSIPFTLKREFFQTRTQKYNVSVTPEVVVYNETQNKILYQGRIDNSYQKLGVRRRVVTSHELKDALKALKENLEIKVKRTKAIGCLITLVE